jgi:hypothetical protein
MTQEIDYYSVLYILERIGHIRIKKHEEIFIILDMFKREYQTFPTITFRKCSGISAIDMLCSGISAIDILVDNKVYCTIPVVINLEF